MRAHRRFLVLAAALALAVTAAPARRAAAQPPLGRVLREIEVGAVEDGTRILVRLDRPVRYLRHSPANSGRTIRIEVEPLALGEVIGDTTLPKRESLPPPPDSPAGLTEVSWESPGGTPDGAEPAELVVRFARTVRFRVEQGDDGRSIAIVVETPGTRALPPAAGDGELAASRLLVEARRAIRDGEDDRAILLLRKQLDAPDADEAVLRDAKELLGLVHERRGQLPHARAEYEEYLARWPDGDASARVRQRLESMLTAQAPKAAELRAAARATEEPVRADLYGSAAVTYARFETIDDFAGGAVYDSSLIGDLSAVGRLRTESLALRAEAVASYRYDVEGRGVGDDTRVSRLLLRANDPAETLTATIGRQSRANGGVLGRFDGVHLAWRFSDRLTWSALAGFPLESTSALGVHTENVLFGTALDGDRLFGDLSGQLFLVGQREASMTERLAVGGELRFARPGRFGLAFVDYDVVFRSLNTALLTGNVTVFGHTDVYLLAETRNSPVLTLDNALIGQTFVNAQVTQIADLRALFSESEIRELAKDRTARTYTGSLGLTHRVDERLQIGGDFTVSSVAGTPSSGGVQGTDPFGPDYAIGLNATRSDFPVQGAFTSGALRYFIGEATDITTLLGTLRVPLRGRDLRGTLRLRGDYRRTKPTGAAFQSPDSVSLRPSVRLDWRWKRLVLDAEVGLDWRQGLGQDSASVDSTGYFAELVLRWDFGT
ncbi:MAG: tetratricopeptide repeat protein [Myxococcota bacterium]|nr:hypothetical protein [Myxococcales bacterium]